jgi:hypothetical protein
MIVRTTIIGTNTRRGRHDGRGGAAEDEVWLKKYESSFFGAISATLFVESHNSGGILRTRIWLDETTSITRLII